MLRTRPPRRRCGYVAVSAARCYRASVANDQARYMDPDAQAVEELRAQCRRDHREVLTPLAATRLFGISNAAVRAARLQGKVKPELTVSITAKHVHLINLESALRYWRLSEAMERTLSLMRSRGTPVAVGHQFYVILHAGEAIQPFDPGG